MTKEEGGRMTKEEEIAKRVAAGVKVLDAHDPNWRQEVHPEQLRMRNVCGCVLGQWAGDYVDGCRTLVGEDEWCRINVDAWASAHGFEVEAQIEVEIGVEYDLLHEAWVEALHD